MKKDEIYLNDIKRILFGEAPPEFLLEVLIRTIVVYLFLLVVTRWLGKRMSGQLTIMEMAVMLTLGAIVSVAMQLPDKGILMAVLVLVCTLLFERGLSWLGFKSARAEKITQGTLSILVKNGVIQHREMVKAGISNQQLFAQLRGEKIYNMGKIKRVYLEACGVFSIIKETDIDKPGLSIYPPDDKAILQEQHSVNLLACINCGFVSASKQNNAACQDCGHNQWTSAAI
jgi:uncharacterized membrane protein YcaP (DUF421 family)